MDYFLTSQDPLAASDAVAALIVTEDRRYLLQARDQKSEIWYPGHWGLFGGAIDKGELPEEALRREIFEELGFTPTKFERFTDFTFDFDFLGQGRYFRTFFEISFSSSELSSLVLGEGKEARLFEGRDVLALERVVPYDAFALWLHLNRARLSSTK